MYFFFDFCCFFFHFCSQKTCAKSHHFYCVKPTLLAPPSGLWFCPDCTLNKNLKWVTKAEMEKKQQKSKKSTSSESVKPSLVSKESNEKIGEGEIQSKKKRIKKKKGK